MTIATTANTNTLPLEVELSEPVENSTVKNVW